MAEYTGTRKFRNAYFCVTNERQITQGMGLREYFRTFYSDMGKISCHPAGPYCWINTFRLLFGMYEKLYPRHSQAGKVRFCCCFIPNKENMNLFWYLKTNNFAKVPIYFVRNVGFINCIFIKWGNLIFKKLINETLKTLYILSNELKLFIRLGWF